MAGLLGLTLAVGAGLLLTQLMMSPPAGELREMAVYLTLAGAGTAAAGWVAVRVVGGAAGRSIRANTFVGAVAGTAVALLNVVIVAELMFISTAHDLKLLIALIAFGGLVSVCFSMWVASTISSRVGIVAAGIRGLALGSHDARLTVEGRDEVARLALDVNVLAERLHAAELERRVLDQERRDLTAAISHDLRTPLASMRAMVEALDDRVVDDPDEVSRYYRTLRREIERLSGMIDDLFELARIDAGALQLDRRPLAVQEIAAEVVDAMQARAQRKGVRLAFHTADVPVASVDGARVERALSNLVQNALDHTGAGGRVDVLVVGVNGFVELRVADSGQGIACEDLPRVWDRFYRSDKSRQRDDNGDRAGLGLAIARGIVEAHGGSVDVKSEPGAGATFALRLPRS